MILVKLPVAFSGAAKNIRGGGRGDALHHSFERVAAEGVDAHFRLVSRRHALELGLLEIGFDIGAPVRRERHQPHAGLRELAGLHGAIADDAVEGRLDFGEAEIALGARDGGLQLRPHPRRLLALQFQHDELRLGAGERGGRACDGGDRLVAVGLRLVEALARGEIIVGQRAGRTRSASALASSARAEASCASACATAEFCASTCAPIRAIVASWVNALPRAEASASA